MNPSRVVWLCCVLVALLSYAFVIAPRERDIADAQGHAALLYQGATINEEHIRAAARLREVQARVAADVRQLAGQTDQSALTAATLRLLSGEADRYRVHVGSITPVAVLATPLPQAGSASAAQPDDPLVGIPADIAITGRFRDVVSFLADVPKHDVLFDVDDVKLGADTSDKSGGSPMLAVTLHATFYRLKPTALMEIDHVTPN